MNASKIEKFEDLIAWQKARNLTKRVYDITKSGEFSKDFGSPLIIFFLNCKNQDLTLKQLSSGLVSTSCNPCIWTTAKRSG